VDLLRLIKEFSSGSDMSSLISSMKRLSFDKILFEKVMSKDKGGSDVGYEVACNFLPN
jgi:hypothetical protein